MNKKIPTYQLLSSHLDKSGQYVITAKIKGVPKSSFTILASKLVKDKKDVLSGFSTEDIIAIVGLIFTDSKMQIVQTTKLGRFKLLPVLSMLFVAITILSAITSAKLVSIFGIIIPLGIAIIPLSYLLLSVVAEVYGYKSSRQLIWSGLFCSCFIEAIILLSTFIPTSNLIESVDKEAYSLIFTLSSRIIFAILLGLIVGEFVNTFFLAKLKLNNLRVSIRIGLALGLGLLCDSILFNFISFYNEISNSELIWLVIKVFVIKYVLSLLFMPLIIYLANYLKAIEDVDVIDIDTKFNPFLLNVDYNINNNLSRTIH